MIPIHFMIRDGKEVRELRGIFEPQATVLDALETLRAAQADKSGQPGRQDPVPLYRHSCHHGSCGTCGAIINGLEALMCLTRLDELAMPRSRVPGGPQLAAEFDTEGAVVIRLEPIRRSSVIAGIAARSTQTFAGLPENLPYLMQAEEFSVAGSKAHLPGDPTRPGRVDHGNAKRAGSELPPNLDESPFVGAPAPRVRFEACIECGLCNSSCPIISPFLGPAVLAALNRQRQKWPDSSRTMLELASAPDGVVACKRHLACSRVCPQSVYPGKHIQLLKNALGVRP